MAASRSLTLRRALGGSLVAGAALVALAGPASAHVEPTPSEVPAGSTQIISFTVPHGCDGSPTTKIDMKIPSGVTVAKAVYVSGWTVTTTKGPITPYKDADGNQITEAVTEVTWTGGPVPDDQVAVFGLSVAFPDKEGESFSFPTVQTCETGSTSWIEATPPGGTEPEHPAPTVTLTKAEPEGGGDATTTEAGKATPVSIVAVTKASDDASTARTFAIVGIAVGALGLLVAIAALLRAKGKGNTPPA